MIKEPMLPSSKILPEIDSKSRETETGVSDEGNAVSFIRLKGDDPGMEMGSSRDSEKGGLWEIEGKRGNEMMASSSNWMGALGQTQGRTRGKYQSQDQAQSQAQDQAQAQGQARHCNGLLNSIVDTSDTTSKTMRKNISMLEMSELAAMSDFDDAMNLAMGPSSAADDLECEESFFLFEIDGDEASDETEVEEETIEQGEKDDLRSIGSIGGMKRSVSCMSMQTGVFSNKFSRPSFSSSIEPILENEDPSQDQAQDPKSPGHGKTPSPDQQVLDNDPSSSSPPILPLKTYSSAFVKGPSPPYPSNEPPSLQNKSCLKITPLRSSIKGSDTRKDSGNSDGKTNLQPPKQMKRNISFSTLEIREYGVTLGDNPGGAAGPPISLDWKYDETQTQFLDVETYEAVRGPRRTRREMHMNQNIRFWRLMRENGFTVRQLQEATESAMAVRKQRRKTNSKQTVDRLQQTLGRIKKTLIGGKKR